MCNSYADLQIQRVLKYSTKARLECHISAVRSSNWRDYSLFIYISTGFIVIR